jgi:hypothetical protein
MHIQLTELERRELCENSRRLRKLAILVKIRELLSSDYTTKYFAWGWWTMMAEVDCSGSIW